MRNGQESICAVLFSLRKMSFLAGVILPFSPSSLLLTLDLLSSSKLFELFRNNKEDKHHVVWFARKHSSRGRRFKPHSQVMSDKEKNSKTSFYPLTATEPSRTFAPSPSAGGELIPGQVARKCGTDQTFPSFSEKTCEMW